MITLPYGTRLCNDERLGTLSKLGISKCMIRQDDFQGSSDADNTSCSDQMRDSCIQLISWSVASSLCSQLHVGINILSSRSISKQQTIVLAHLIA
jgi:hypothetical protein